MTTFLFTRIHNKILYNKITQWFHTCIENKENEGTPAETIMELCDNFLTMLNTKRLNLGVPETVFRRNICAALCTMKYFNNLNIYRSGKTQNRNPSIWTDELEEIWQDWIYNRCFVNWPAFWARLPVREWEQEIPEWRNTLEDLLPTYVMREISVLIRHGIIVEDDSGEYIDSNNYDYVGDTFE